MTRSKAEIIRRPNRLKAKVSGTEHAGPGKLAPELVAQAEAVVTEYSSNYPAHAQVALARLLAASAAVMQNPRSCREQIARLRAEAREIMGQGETFGYVLLSRFARSLYEICEGWESLSPQQATLVQAHTDAMAIIIHSRIAGDGGAVGRELMKSLMVARTKFASSQAGVTDASRS
jgi:hypothetical protein